MKYFDEARPRIGDRPALFWNESPIPGVIPDLSIRPIDGGQDMEITVCVLTAPATGKILTARTDWSKKWSLEWFVGAYLTDPEAMLREAFGWKYERGSTPHVRAEKLSIENLGEL